ncbi:MAG: hypothetical protein E7666_05655 [Ruminococcaceae bacterium]|nr:hypothetical protein [Oscillospiraceae bacterium]
MKYRVVGWTDFDSETVDGIDGNSFAERNAIIDEIRKNGYRFTGWDHQEMQTCTPVLNDGKARYYSQRGWGSIMAEAHERVGDYAGYAFGSGSNMPCDEFDPARFTPENDLQETFTVDVEEDIFALAQKKNPFFMEDLPALRMIDRGDTLTLRCKDAQMTVLVTDIDRSRNIRRKDRVYDYVIHSKYKLVVTGLKQS